MLKSARQISFTILILAGISIQLGWFERERIERHAVYSYIEKLLNVSEVLQSSLPTASISLTSLSGKTPPILNLTAGPENPAAIFVRTMAANNYAEVTLAGDIEQSKTLGDPGGDCTIRIFRGTGTGEHGIEKINALSKHQRYSEILAAPNGSTYLLLFGRACLYIMGSTEPALIVYELSKPKFASPSMVISTWVAEAADLPLDTDANRENEEFLYRGLYQTEAFERLSDLGDLTKPAYTEAVLRAAVSREATKLSGIPFELSDWRKAIAKIYERSARAPSILGFSLPSEVAAFLLPLVLCPVVFSFLFRVRRLGSKAAGEAWLLLHSRGVFENTGAAILLSILLVAPAATMWGLSAYAPGQVEEMFTSLQIATGRYESGTDESGTFHAIKLFRMPAFWALAVTILSTVMIARAMYLIIVLRRNSLPQEVERKHATHWSRRRLRKLNNRR